MEVSISDYDTIKKHEFNITWAHTCKLVYLITKITSQYQALCYPREGIWKGW